MSNEPYDFKIQGTKTNAKVIRGAQAVTTLDGDGIALNTDNAAGDAFGRLRTSEPQTVFESKLLNGSGAKTWSTEASGSYTAAKNDTTSSYDMNVSSSGSYVIRQTLQRFNYQAGKSQFALMTGILPKKAGINAALGLADGEHGNHVVPYDIYNGIYIETRNNIAYATIANNGVYNRIAQSNWDDPLDGTGESGITLDFTNGQIWVIDYEWLGLGRVRFGVNVDGKTVYFHSINHANNVTNVYTKSSNLPVRYELRSVGATGSMKQICCSISSEGGRQPSGIIDVGSTNYLNIPSSSIFSVNATTHSIFSAIRHQEDKPYSFIDLNKQEILTLGDNPLKWSIALVPGNTVIKDNGVATSLDDLTFTKLDDTTIEFFAFNIAEDTVFDTAISPYIIEEGFIPAGSGVGAGQSGSSTLQNTKNLRSIGEEVNGSRWCYLFTIQSYGTNEARASLKYNEVI